MSQILDKPLRLTELARLPHTVNSGGNEWRMCCPVHGGSNPTAFCVELTSGLYHCFACGAGGRLLEFWERENQKPEKKSYLISSSLLLQEETRQKAAMRIEVNSAKIVESNSTNPETAACGEVRMKVAQTRLALITRNPAAREREAQTVLNYLKQRGISLETVLRAGVGYEAAFSFRVTGPGKIRSATAPGLSQRRVIVPALLFPLHDPTTGDFLNFYARGISPTKLRLHHVGRGRKGLFNAGVVKPIEVEPLLVVEGVFDALAWLQAGYCRVVALTGTSLLQPEWFREAGPIIVAFDNDLTGRLAQEKAHQILAAMGLPCSSLTPQFYQGHKDFADLWKYELSHRNKLGNFARTFLCCISTLPA